MQLTIEKLVLDIEEICMNDQLFGHLIDEILSFEQDLKTMLSYPNTLPSAVCVLTQPFYFTRWLSIEEKCKYYRIYTFITYFNNISISHHG